MADVRVSVLMPFRGDGAFRTRNFKWVSQRWQHYFPEFEYCIHDDDDDYFHRGRARNKAFRQSSGDLLIIADADTTFGDPAQITAALAVARNDEWVLPYGGRHYLNLTEDSTNAVLALSPDTLLEYGMACEHELESWAGLLVLPRHAFEIAGGYDERFQGWGGEDCAFQIALDTLYRPFVRLPMTYCFHLWHPAPERSRFGAPSWPHNRWLLNEYRRRHYNAHAMRDFVNHR